MTTLEMLKILFLQREPVIETAEEYLSYDAHHTVHLGDAEKRNRGRTFSAITKRHFEKKYGVFVGNDFVQHYVDDGIPLYGRIYRGVATRITQRGNAQSNITRHEMVCFIYNLLLDDKDLLHAIWEHSQKYILEVQQQLVGVKPYEIKARKFLRHFNDVLFCIFGCEAKQLIVDHFRKAEPSPYSIFDDSYWTISYARSLRESDLFTPKGYIPDFSITPEKITVLGAVIPTTDEEYTSFKTISNITSEGYVGDLCEYFQQRLGSAVSICNYLDNAWNPYVALLWGMREDCDMLNVFEFSEFEHMTGSDGRSLDKIVCNGGQPFSDAIIGKLSSHEMCCALEWVLLRNQGNVMCYVDLALAYNEIGATHAAAYLVLTAYLSHSVGDSRKYEALEQSFPEYLNPWIARHGRLRERRNSFLDDMANNITDSVIDQLQPKPASDSDWRVQVS